MEGKSKISRRGFISGASLLAAGSAAAGLTDQYTRKGIREQVTELSIDGPASPEQLSTPQDWLLDLSPASWIWYPAKRILPNSFFHFRKNVTIQKPIAGAKGWIVGDSRYVLFCNGKRIQFGPAPADPRFTEADPVDLGSQLIPGTNTIGATVLYYGFGDGTWPTGKAGFIFRLELIYEDGSREVIVSDDTWKVQLARSWQPGMYKRWYLRALQESFDNRFYPHGWNLPSYQMDGSWKNAVVTGTNAAQTAMATSLSDYLYDSGSPSVSQLRKRRTPLVREVRISAITTVEAHWVSWKIPPEEYFDMVTGDAFEPVSQPVVTVSGNPVQTELTDPLKGFVITYALEEQMVGWPAFKIHAPAGTIIELMVQQGHIPFQKGGPALINTNLHSWTRFICKEGMNEFMSFDYESVKWIQLHIHGVTGNIEVFAPELIRRIYDFPHQPVLSVSDPKLQKLFGASFNTVFNNSQDTIVDCMGRERQQYSGDIGHVVHILHRAFGDQALPARFVNTYSQGMTNAGYFMDCWPAYDRLNRLSQRELGLTPYGPILDHSVGFNYDTWYHYLYSGNQEDLAEAFPRLEKFFRYILASAPANTLLPVENLGIPTVWMDTDSYKKQRHKQCAYNLYVAGMLKDAFAPLCTVFGKHALKETALQKTNELVKAVRKNFWSSVDGMLINNLPWYGEEKEARTCERSISHYLLGNFASEPEKKNLLEEMISLPGRFGSCYPANAHWKYWALGHENIIQPVIDELRRKWYPLDAVQFNNTMPETWIQIPDRHAQYSHASLAPVYSAYMCIAGISNLEPGGRKVSIKPLPGDLSGFSIEQHSPAGKISLSWEGNKGNRLFTVTVPDSVIAELNVDEREKLSLPFLRKEKGRSVYLLKGGSWQDTLKYT